MATVTYQNAPAAMPADLFSKAVLLRLSFGRFGNTRKAPLSKVDVAADKSRLRLSKKLLVSPELDAIESFDGKLREWTQGRCIPLPGFSGVQVLGLDGVEAVNEKLLTAEKAERPALVEKFLEVYPLAVEQARADLGPLWNPLDYPGPGKVKSLFYLDYRYFSLATPGSLGNFSVRLFQQERDKAARLWEDTMTEGIGYLRNIFLELVKHAQERLTPDEDGIPKTFQKSTIDKLKEFLETFEIRNIANDRELAPLVQKMRWLMEGVDAESLRTSDMLRERMAQQFAKIASQVDQMPAVKRTRLITFED
jgi:hypothetical protein